MNYKPASVDGVIDVNELTHLVSEFGMTPFTHSEVIYDKNGLFITRLMLPIMVSGNNDWSARVVYVAIYGSKAVAVRGTINGHGMKSINEEKERDYKKALLEKINHAWNYSFRT